PPQRPRPGRSPRPRARARRPRAARARRRTLRRGRLAGAARPRGGRAEPARLAAARPRSARAQATRPSALRDSKRPADEVLVTSSACLPSKPEARRRRSTAVRTLVALLSVALLALLAFSAAPAAARVTNVPPAEVGLQPRISNFDYVGLVKV